MVNNKDEYFTRIANPRETRKIVLESTRDVLKILKSHEDFKRAKEAKTTMMTHFRGQMDEVRSLIQQFKKSLPKTTIKPIRPSVIRSVTAEKPAEHEIKKLEEELADIESKLSELS